MRDVFAKMQKCGKEGKTRDGCGMVDIFVLGLTQEWLRELSFSRLECGVHDRLHIYPLCGIFYFPWHGHQKEGTNGFSVSSERHRDTQSLMLRA